ncbi:hypothetical protein [Flavobacterium flavigenum]|uniref:hypothetical protein n=1 Tax=Flavobacterium flavigenum TaxID=3003258 RepID=UPI0024823177|nr:hypothetical protein [Flavobacterium flavigenum]
MKQIKNLYEYIDLMKTRIMMTVGEKSLSALYFHVKGYEVGCKENERLEPEFHLFHDFVANYYLRSESTAGWRNIILAESYGNEEQALETFFVLFDDFRRNVKPKNSKKILLDLLEKIILNENDFLENLVIEFTDEDYNIFKLLINKIASVSFLSDYDELLNQIKALTINSKKIQDLLI